MVSWSEALEIIPGGNGLISKRPERYSLNKWPVYFSRAKGIEILGLDGNKYIDAAQMGIGTAILGYTNSEVDDAVKAAIDKGVNTTLNCPEEFLLAQKLIELNPFAGGVKFTRSGGEAMAMAVRIARAFSGKDKIAFSGYHGWHDWYLSANLGGDNLRHHLLSGVKPKGVPRGLKDTVFPFSYNDIEDLNRVINEEDIGTVIIEGARHEYPTQEFLTAIQNLCIEKNITIIVDEITSGWRVTDGGVYKNFDFHPDIVVYGKGMGNGYAIASVVGKKTIMDAAESTFISSTFWTERIGFVAALKTLEILIENKIYNHLNYIGNLIGEGWRELSQKHGIDLEVTDFKPLITFKYKGKNPQNFNQKFTERMLERGYLAAPSIYVSSFHDELFVEKYLENLDNVWSKK